MSMYGGGDFVSSIKKRGPCAPFFVFNIEAMEVDRNDEIQNNYRQNNK